MALPPVESLLAEMERLIRRDPGRRGLIDTEAERGPLCAGHLATAADHLARFGKTVWIVTGFYIPGASPPAAETDGPPGSALLAAALHACGMTVRLITDAPCAASVQVVVSAYGLPAETVHLSSAPPAKGGLGGGLPSSSFSSSTNPSPANARTPPNPPLAGGAKEGTPPPTGGEEAFSCPPCQGGVGGGEGHSAPNRAPDFSTWLTNLLASPDAEHLTHLIAIERVGPSHTIQTFAGRRDDSDPAVQRFRNLVPSNHHNHCHNMRGEIIDAHTAPLHELFERIAQLRPGVRTIGIGDGGNELGLGAVPWDELQARLTGPAAPLVPCRIATDWTVVAGVSNWGAQALAAAVCLLRGRSDCLAEFDIASEERRLQQLVQDGPAVDGVTRLPQATVDGLPFLTYIQPWDGLRRLLGLQSPGRVQ